MLDLYQRYTVDYITQRLPAHTVEQVDQGLILATKKQIFAFLEVLPHQLEYSLQPLHSQFASPDTFVWVAKAMKPAQIRHFLGQSLELLVKYPAEHEYLYVGNVFCSSVGYTCKTVENATFNLNDFLPYAWWVYSGGYPHWLLQINSTRYFVRTWEDVYPHIQIIDEDTEEDWDVSLYRYPQTQFTVLLKPDWLCVYYQPSRQKPAIISYNPLSTIENEVYFHMAGGHPTYMEGVYVIPRQPICPILKYFLQPQTLPQQLSLAGMEKPNLYPELPPWIVWKKT